MRTNRSTSACIFDQKAEVHGFIHGYIEPAAIFEADTVSIAGTLTKGDSAAVTDTVG